MSKKIILATFLLTLFIQQSLFAKDAMLYSNSKFQDRCILLGPDPSFIIKFKNHASALAGTSALKKDALRKLSSSGLSFSKYQQMPDGDYLLSFSAPALPNSASIQDKAGCYSKEMINHFVDHIKKEANAEYVIPNRLSAPLQLSMPAVNTLQWNLLSPPGGIDVQGAWDFTRGNPNRVVAVFDTGQLNHEALNSNTLPGVTFTNNTFYSGHHPAQKKVNGYNHGTHVAGIIASSGNAAYGQNIYGVAPATKVLPVNIFTVIDQFWTCWFAGTDAPCLLTYQQDQINAMNWLAGYKKARFDRLPAPPEGIVGINMSLGGAGECDPKIQSAFDRLLAKNIAIAVAAGNSNKDTKDASPANCRGVIAVAAVGPDGFRAYHQSVGQYSNYGETVKIAAPGGSFWGSSKDEIYSTGNASYFYAIGTSMASPHVAGLIALLSSVDPTLSPEMVLEIIQSTATPFPVSSDHKANCKGEKSCGAGIINAAAAVKKAKEQAAMMSWKRNLQVSVMSGTQALIAWEAGEWHPKRTMPVVYTVQVNNIDVPECTHIASTQCQLTSLKPGNRYQVRVRATDPKQLYPYEQSVEAQFSTH